MRSSKQFVQVGFKKVAKVNKQNCRDSINRPKSRGSALILQKNAETDALLGAQTHLRNQKQKLRPKPPLRRRLQSFEENSIRRYTKSYLKNTSHRSRSRSKLDERLDEMLINQRVKEEAASQRRSSTLIMNTTDKLLPTEASKLDKSVRQTTLSKYLGQLAQGGNTSGKKTKNEQYIVNELSSIIVLIDGIFGVSRSEKLVGSFREEKSLSIPSLIATIKTKLQTAAKDSKIKPHVLPSNA